MTDLIAGTAIKYRLTQTGATITADILPTDFLIAAARNIDRSGRTILVNGTQYDLDTLAIVNA